MNILDHDQLRLFLSRRFNQPRYQRLLSGVSNIVVHGIIERSQFGRLRQVQEVVQENFLIGIDGGIG